MGHQGVDNQEWRNAEEKLLPEVGRGTKRARGGRNNNSAINRPARVDPEREWDTGKAALYLPERRM